MLELFVAFLAAVFPGCADVPPFTPCVYLSDTQYVENTRPGDFYYNGGNNAGQSSFFELGTNGGESL